MGLAAAFHAAKSGHDVTVLEAAPEPGGMAAHFDLDGLSIERFYHFVCKSDGPTFELLAELGLPDSVRWRTTTMGVFSDGKLHEWGNPIALLKYPGLSLIDRLRYGLLAWVSTRRDRWDALEHQSAKQWLLRWCGKRTYEKVWKPLLELKFHEYADDISAAWMWTRIKRVGRSRKSIMQEELGYIEGGSQTLVDLLMKRIGELGGSIRLGMPVEEIVVERGRVTGIRANGEFLPADFVISSVPIPLVPRMVPSLPAEWRERYEAIQSIGVVCVVFKLRRSVTPHFWVNVSEPGIEIPGLIEFSNLRPTGTPVVFVPYYMPKTHPRFSWPDGKIVGEAFGYLQRVNPELTPDDIIATYVGRLSQAQPVCPPGFAAMIPPVQTPVEGLQIADTCFYYPEDRGIAESVRLAKDMARRVDEQSRERAA